MSATWLGEWPDRKWQVWDYSVSHAQLVLRGVPDTDPGGPCVDLLFKPTRRLATSTMSWSGLRLALRRVTPEGDGVFFIVSARPDGPHHGHGVVRAGSLHLRGGLRYFEDPLATDSHASWQRLWGGSA